MNWKEAHTRLRESLRGELRKQWGGIAEIEEGVSCSQGYLNKLSSGTHEFKLDLFLRTLEVLELDPRAFFSRALGIEPTLEDYLLELEDGAREDRAFSRIARVSRQLEVAEPETPDPAATADERHVAELAGCASREQHRRLRCTRKYRTRAFSRAYLEHLDSLRYDNAVQAAKLVEKVATHLIPKLPGERDERLALQCLALGIFGSARRRKGRLADAARAFRLALELSRRAHLRAETAALLQRASYLLKDVGHFERSLSYLREALEIYVDLGSETGIAKTLVDRGMMLCYLGEYDTAVAVLEQALRRLDGSGQTRNLFAVHQFLAYAHEQLGDLDAAERQLETATTFGGLEHGFFWSKLRWLQGTLALKRGAYRRSEELLRSAWQVLSDQEHPAQAALLSVDLVEALLAQERLEEACALATSMARLLESMRNNHLAKKAVYQLVRSGLDGKLTRQLLGKVRSQLQPDNAARQVAPRSR